MSKLVKILDRKPMEIYIGRKTRGPIIGVRLDETVIGRLLRSVDAPRDIYAMGPANKSVKLTLENYMLSEEELFGETKKEETSRLVDSIKDVLNKNTIEDTKTAQVDNTKDTVEEDKSKKINENETVALGEASIPEDIKDDAKTETEVTVVEGEPVTFNNVTTNMNEKENNVVENTEVAQVEKISEIVKPQQHQNYNKNKKNNNYKK